MLFVLTCCLFCFCYRLFVVCVFFCVVTERAKVFAGILCSLWDLIIHSGPLFLLCYPFVVTVFWFLVGLTNPKNYLPSFSKTIFLLLCLSSFSYILYHNLNYHIMYNTYCSFFEKYVFFVILKYKWLSSSSARHLILLNIADIVYKKTKFCSFGSKERKNEKKNVCCNGYWLLACAAHPYQTRPFKFKPWTISRQASIWVRWL